MAKTFTPKQDIHRGFTLIEMLVVITVITLLAAILMPVLERVRARADITSCTSNVKQILLAFHQYTQDYDERLPHWTDPTGSTIGPNGPYLDASGYGGGNTGVSYGAFGFGGATNVLGACMVGGVWTGACLNDDALWQADRPLNPYVKDDEVFLCPTWGAARLAWGAGGYESAQDVLGNSYAVNTRLIYPAGWKDGRSQGGDLGWGYTAGAQNSVSLSQIVSTEWTGLIADGYMAYAGGTGATTQFYHGGDPADTSTAARPQKCWMVYGFVDGHAKLMNPGSCYQGNVAWYDGGTISWMDDRYKDSTWRPGTTGNLSGRPTACG
jgi:prepilin-type N-terminal cleavage/methylation domain-containing protein